MERVRLNWHVLHLQRSLLGSILLLGRCRDKQNYIDIPQIQRMGRLDYTHAAFALRKTMRVVNIPLDQRILYMLDIMFLALGVFSALFTSARALSVF